MFSVFVVQFEQLDNEKCGVSSKMVLSAYLNQNGFTLKKFVSSFSIISPGTQIVNKCLINRIARY